MHTATSTNRRLRPLLALLVALALLAAACSDDDAAGRSDGERWAWPSRGDDSTTTTEGRDQPPNGSSGSGIEWSTSGSLHRGMLEVPLDHDDPDAGTIDIAVARRPASDPEGRIGVILINPGGPGASGIDMAGFFGLMFGRDLTDRFDLVTWDPRGVGASTQVRCGDGEFMDRYVAANPTPATPEAEAEVEALMREFAELCDRDSGDLLPHLHTEASARDMDVIREALGEDQINYVGFSYGTYLGATYTELFPDRVRAVVLDGAYSRSLGLADKSEGQALGFERSLQAFLDWCQPERCSFAEGGDTGAGFDALIAAIGDQPLPTNDPEGRELSVGLAWTGVLAALYSPELWSQLDRGLTRARDDGDGSGLLMLADYYNGREPGAVFEALHYAFTAYNCMDTPAPTPTEESEAINRVLEVAPRVGPVFVSTPSPCEFWTVEAHGTPRPFSIPDAPPILVIATTGDPATPYEWGVQLADELATGHLLTVEGEGHTAFGGGNRCVDSAVEAYLLELELPEADFACAA